MTMSNIPDPKEQKGVDDDEPVTLKDPEPPMKPASPMSPLKPEPSTPDANPIDPRVGQPW